MSSHLRMRTSRVLNESRPSPSWSTSCAGLLGEQAAKLCLCRFLLTHLPCSWHHDTFLATLIEALDSEASSPKPKNKSLRMICTSARPSSATTADAIINLKPSWILDRTPMELCFLPAHIKMSNPKSLSARMPLQSVPIAVPRILRLRGLHREAHARGTAATGAVRSFSSKLSVG